tara:strand:- start:787 stop:1107 length:321 start_codon:yes stop_codon:yes gene_type:complete
MSDTMWNNAVNQMIDAINSDNNIRDYLIKFMPDDNTGYSWTQDTRYKQYSHILDIKTNSTGHSGASFACCLREAVDIIRKGIVIADEVQSDNDINDDNIITLEPIS